MIVYYMHRKAHYEYMLMLKTLKHTLSNCQDQIQIVLKLMIGKYDFRFLVFSISSEMLEAKVFWDLPLIIHACFAICHMTATWTVGMMSQCQDGKKKILSEVSFPLFREAYLSLNCHFRFQNPRRVVTNYECTLGRLGAYPEIIV